MKTLIYIALLLASLQLTSQVKEVSFRGISEEEIKMTKYEKDLDAKAVVLFDKGKSVFFVSQNGGYDIRFTQHKRIKIFDASQDGVATVEIPYYVDGYNKTEQITSIEAFTYNTQNGSILWKALDPSTIYEEKVNERWRVKKFTFPDIQDGSILEFRYTLESPFHFKLPDWEFQNGIPTLYSEYEVRLIPFYEYVYIAKGIKRFDYQTSVKSKEKRTHGSVSGHYAGTGSKGFEFNDIIHTYVMKDVPSFTDESYITSRNDHIMSLDFQLAKVHPTTGGTREIMSTWSSLNKDLLKYEKFGKYMKNCAKQAKKLLASEVDLAGLDQKAKAKRVIEYVKNSFEWSGYNGKYATQSTKEFITKKNGNAADINLFLIAMLSEAGIPTEPVILSTRNHGKISRDYPFDHFTNYVIAMVKLDHVFLADATEDMLPYNHLPMRCYNDLGLVVNEIDQAQWINLRNTVSSIKKVVFNYKLDTSTLDINSKVFIQTTNYEAHQMRKRFKNDSSEVMEYYGDQFQGISRASTFGYEKTHIPYSIQLEGVYETEKLGENIVIKPFLDFPVSKNSLTQKKRSYPVDFGYPWNDQFEFTLEIPNGYSVSSLTESYEMNNELAEINLKYTSSDGILSAKGNYEFKKSVYSSAEYARVKHYLDQIIKYFNQPIVLEITP